MIEIKGLSKSFGELQALSDINVTIPRGSICGVLGPNGAGKTTLFKILCKLSSYEGSFHIDSNRLKPIGAIIEKPKLYGYMNMQDNLRLFAGIQGLTLEKDHIYSTLQAVGLPVDRTDPVRNFSMGMKQRLGIAIALLNRPEVLILDEPFSGLDPMGVREFRKLILNLVEEESLTVLISSHLLFELENLCDQLVILRDGQVFRQGPMHDLTSHESHQYRITGIGLDTSQTLKAKQLIVKNNAVTITLSSAEANQLLQSLIQENIEIRSFTPLDSIERYFEL